MRVIIVLLAAVTVLAWLGYEVREKSRDLSNALLGLSVVLTVLLFGALFGLYGG